MKKIIAVSILFAFVFCFSGCDEKNPEISQESLFFENTEWGMSKAETMKSLNLKKDDLVEKPPTSNDYLDTFEVKDYKYKNKKCDMILSFVNDKTKTINAEGLWHVKIYSDDKAFVLDEFNTYKSKFEGMQTTDDTERIYARWESTKNARDYAIKNNVNLQDYIKSTDLDNSTTYTDEEILTMLGLYSRELSSLSVSVYENPDAKGYAGTITFSGLLYAEISAFKK